MGSLVRGCLLERLEDAERQVHRSAAHTELILRAVLRSVSLACRLSLGRAGFVDRPLLGDRLPGEGATRLEGVCGPR
jgi:hypothetical protein